jgi:hypothetical protein
MNLNAVQKAALSFFICFAIGGVFFQNPLSGYSLLAVDDSRPCTPEEKSQMRSDYLLVEKTSPGGNTAEQIEEKVKNSCGSPYLRAEYLPFDEWRSNMPFVYWLGSVMNLVFSICTLAVMAIAVSIVFRTPKAARSPAQDK